MYNYFREFILYPNIIYLGTELKHKKESVILIGTPLHKNLGDHLIAKHEKEFLFNIYGKENVIEIPTEVFVIFGKNIINKISTRTLIFISGGGWMGDVWEQDERCMQTIISTFKNNRVIVLPQTLYFSNEYSQSSRELIDSARHVYSSCKNLTLLFREENSCNVAKKLYRDTVALIKLFPDMALYTNKYEKSNKKNGWILCLRDDREKVCSDSLDNSVYALAKIHGKTVRISSTIANHAVPIWLRNYRIRKKIKEFSKAELVVTDRLHGMIFAAISGTKCIAFDNQTKKVSGVYKQWLYSNKEIIVLPHDASADDVVHSIEKIYKVENNTFSNWRENLDNHFMQLKEYLEEIDNES